MKEQKGNVAQTVVSDIKNQIWMIASDLSLTLDFTQKHQI